MTIKNRIRSERTPHLIQHIIAIIYPPMNTEYYIANAPEVQILPHPVSENV